MHTPHGTPPAPQPDAATQADAAGAVRWRPVACTRRHWLAGALRSAFAAPLARALLPWLAPALGAGSGLAVSASRANPLPALGDGSDMTVTEERWLGDQIARSLYRDPAYLDDPALDDYLSALWQPLWQAARQRGDLPDDQAERYAWRLLLGRDRTVNAFALPGGYFGVHLGLIAVTGSADELASVLAHELSHVTQRHIARLLSRQSQQAPLVLAAMILGALAASASRNADIASAAIAGGQAVALQNQLNFSRDMEREADRIGLGLLVGAGFDGYGFIGMFERLQQAARLNDDGSFPYLRSHPLTTERIADMRARLPLAAVAPSRAAAVSPRLHAFMAARAAVLADPTPDRLRAHASGTGSGAARPYAQALAAALLREGDAAWRALTTVKDAAAGDADAQRAARQLELELALMLAPTSPAVARPGGSLQTGADTVLPGDGRTGLTDALEQALADGSRASLLLAARVAPLAAAPWPARVQPRLQAWCVQHPDDGSAWLTLAGLLHAMSRPVAAARAEGEAQLARLDPQGALDRFRAAQRLAQERGERDLLELSVLDARARHAQALLQDQAAEAARRR
ncbi:M48 family metalloprotease [Tepidimonas sp.]|uniref:M48 family metalloprotease n=1 Tax=Tepidimonas sp. TaxID=2002775 RepID=UPI002FE41A3A